MFKSIEKRIIRSSSNHAKTFIRFWVVLLALASLALAADAPGVKVTKKVSCAWQWHGFDYIVFDGSSNRLYVSHGTEVDVLDADSGTVLGKIEDTPGVHGIAIDPDLHRGFTTNGREATVSAFDTRTFQTLEKIPVADDQDFVRYDPQTHRILVRHGDVAALTAIDPDKDEVIGKIDLGGGAEASTLDEKDNGFVNLEAEAMVASFDPSALTIKQKWPITGCAKPTGMAIDAADSRLFIGCRSKVLAVMDAGTGQGNHNASP